MDDNTFECPNCGAKVYPEMTRCPQCGHNMYPEDEDALPAVDGAGQPGVLVGIGGLVIGGMIAGGIALLLNFILANFQSAATLDLGGKTVLWLAGPIGAAVGSYVAAGIARHWARWLGVVVGIITLPTLALLAMHWWPVSLDFLLNPWVLSCAVFTVVCGFFGGWVYHKFSLDKGWKEKWQIRGWEDMLYQDLLRKVRFNGSIADRLIEYERKQDPQAGRLKLIQNAIERWERDNR